MANDSNDLDTLRRALDDFVNTLEWSSNDVKASPDGLYYYRVQMMPDTDLNREIVDAGVHQSYPVGALCVRAYEGNWIMAVLPSTFVGLDLYTIVSILWPGYASYVTLAPDSRDRAPSAWAGRLRG